MAAKKEAAKKQKAPTDQADVGLVIDLDPGSFNQMERRELQDQFGLNFEKLLDYVDAAVMTHPPSDEVIQGPAGAVYADEVLIAMIVISQRRNNPTAAARDWAEYGLRELRQAIARGQRLAPKATTSTSSRTE